MCRFTGLLETNVECYRALEYVIETRTDLRLFSKNVTKNTNRPENVIGECYRNKQNVIASFVAKH